MRGGKENRHRPRFDDVDGDNKNLGNKEPEDLPKKEPMYRIRPKRVRKPKQEEDESKQQEDGSKQKEEESNKKD